MRTHEEIRRTPVDVAPDKPTRLMALALMLAGITAQINLDTTRRKSHERDGHD